MLVDRVRTRTVRPKDLERVSVLHAEAFPDSALTLLGPRAVVGYYEWQLAGPHELVALVAQEDEELLGFIWAGRFRGALGGYLRHNSAFLVGALLRQPRVLIDSRVSGRLYPGALALARHTTRNARRQRAPAVPAPCAQTFGVLSLAVKTEVRGSGVAGLLLNEAERHAREGGHERMHLTVTPGNTLAIRFYERHGWVRTPGSDGVWSGEMHKSLTA